MQLVLKSLFPSAIDEMNGLDDISVVSDSTSPAVVVLLRLGMFRNICDFLARLTIATVLYFGYYIRKF